MATTHKISKKQLREAIEKLTKQALLESTPFTAMRQIEHAATSTSMEFEKSICDVLNLQNPDDMSGELQEKYFAVVQLMKNGIVSAIMNAAKQLVSFPKDQEQPGKK